jgi:hypothetical protein
MSFERVINLYDLMDAAYYCPEIELTALQNKQKGVKTNLLQL